MNKFILRDKSVRARAAQCIWEVPEGYVVRVTPPVKSRLQEERYHAMIGDIAKQWKFMGKLWHEEDVKRLMVDQFASVMRDLGTPLHHDGRVVPSIDGTRVVQLGIQTSKFWKNEASEFIEFLFSFGAEHDIQWSDPAK